MSYGAHTHNPWEDDHSIPEDESRFPCACGDPHCFGDGDDPQTIRIGRAFYASDCPMAQRLNLIADGRELASRADVARDDDQTFIRR